MAEEAPITDPQNADELLKMSGGDKESALEVAQLMLADAEKAKGKAVTAAEKLDAVRQAKRYRKMVEELTKPEEAEQLGNDGKEPQSERNTDQEQSNSVKTEKINLSDEIDENGRQFVLTSNGDLAFGEIGEDTGLTAAPILLSEGMITNAATNDGYGLAHIEARHGDQIRKAGYKSVVDFIETVAKNYDVIKEGNPRDGHKTYRLLMTDKHNNTLMVELSGDGTYWNINTAGIFKTSYGKKSKEVYNRHTTAKQSAETTGTSQDVERDGTQTSSSMNVPTPSVGKDKDNGGKPQEKTQTNDDRRFAEQPELNGNHEGMTAVKQSDGSYKWVGLQRGEASEGMTDKEIAMLDDMAKRLNLPIVAKRFGDSRINGVYQGGVIYINPDRDKTWTMRWVAGHELLHDVEKLSPDMYADYRKAVESLMGERVFNEKVEEIMQDYEDAGHPIDRAQAEKEVVNDYGGDLFSSRDGMKIMQGILDKAGREGKPEFVKRIMEWWDRIKEFFTGSPYYADVQKAMEKAYADAMKNASEKAQRDNGRAEMSAKRKRALETAEQSQRTAIATVVSSDDGTKILNNLDTITKELEKSSSHRKTFIGDLAKSLGMADRGKSSQYATFETKNGKVVTIRLSNHNATVSNFDAVGESDGISIVVTRKPNNGITNDGMAHIVEFFYPEIALQRAEGKPLAEIAKSIKQVLYSGEFKDTTGLAEVQEVNGTELGGEPLSAKIGRASAVVDTEPTEAQKEAGNYKKGHVQIGKFDISIEQPEGSIRRGKDADGKQWESKMHNTYGYIRGTEGVDGDHIDVFLSNDIDGWNGEKAFVVDQYNPDGTFDEHKVMLGFNDADTAKSDYLANYENGWENGRRIDVTETDLADFEKWIAQSRRKTKPFGEYSSVKKNADNAEYSVKKNDDEDKTLFGMHNISIDNMRRAIKQGGLAAPSMGVVDTKKGVYSGYGEITLIPRAEKIAKRTGKNIGTYSADAWTPTYPQVERQFDENGSLRAYKDVEAVPDAMRRMTRNALDSFMDGREADDLAYMYLQEKGKMPEMTLTERQYPEALYKEVEKVLGENKGLYGTSEEQRKRVLDIYVREKFGGDMEEYDRNLREQMQKKESMIARFPKSRLARDAQMDLDDIRQKGYDYSALSRFVEDIARDEKNAGKVDEYATMRKAKDIISANGLQDDFKQWKESLNDRYNVKEVIFAGFTPDGKRKYVPNTLENAVAMMKKDGKNAATGTASFSRFVASVLKPMGTLDQIRKQKGRLTTDKDAASEFQEKWQPVYFELAEKMQPDAKGFESYGLDRIEEVASQKNPQKYAKEEYGIDLTDEDAKKLDGLVKAIRTEKPSVYFETKFMRPYGLEEFEKAIVPKDTPKDVTDALKKAGIEVHTYNGKEDREQVTLDAVNSDDDIRFSIKREVQDNISSDEDARKVIGRMKDIAEETPHIEISDDTWKNYIQTPIGRIKMGKNQKEKLLAKNRDDQYGMVVRTLESPDVVLEETDTTDDTAHERPSSYLFVKTFKKEDGSKYTHFENVTVSQDGMEVSISSHIIRENQLRKKLKNDRLLYKATALDTPANVSAEQPASDGSLSSAAKVIETFEPKKEIGENNSSASEFSSDAEESYSVKSARHRSPEAEKRDSMMRNVDRAVAFVTGKTEKEAREERRRKEQKFREETKDLYDRVLSGNFDDVTLQKLNDFINNVTPLNYYGRPLSKRLPQRVGQKVHGGEQANSVDALFSRISESAVRPNERTRPEARRRIEEKKKELLKGWAIATGHWHTDLSDFTDDKSPIGSGKDSDVYTARDGNHVIKVSKGKDSLKKFAPDIDAVALFNYVFPNSKYDILGYGEIGGKFVKFLQQPIVDFTDSTPLSAEERVAYMDRLGFKPINKELTAFSNGQIAVADLQKGNIIKDKAGNVRVIDADVKLHTRDFGGDYTYPPVEGDTAKYSIVGERGAKNLDKAEERTLRMDNLTLAREMESAEKDAKTIRLATGWERGADGKWRYEIPDALFNPNGWIEANRKAVDNMDAKDYRALMRYLKESYDDLSDVKRKNFDSLMERTGYRVEEKLTLGDVLYGKGKDELFNAYPEIKDIRIKFANLPYGTYGRFSAADKTIELETGLESNTYREKARWALVHEIQHAIQDIEGFARGGNPQDIDKGRHLINEVSNRVKTGLDEAAKISGVPTQDEWLKSLDGEEMKAVGEKLTEYHKQNRDFDLSRIYVESVGFKEADRDALLSKLDKANEIIAEQTRQTGANDGRSSFEAYMSLGGEVEARNVQKRMTMYDDERRKTLLADTEDIAREDQIFLFGKRDDESLIDYAKRKTEEAQYSLKPFGGNSGYVGYSKSKRAVDAEKRGLRSVSQMDKEFADRVREIVTEESGKEAKITLAEIRRTAKGMRGDEWHHTSMYGNRTRYYSAESIADEFLGRDEYKSEERKAAEQEEMRKRQDAEKRASETRQRLYDALVTDRDVKTKVEDRGWKHEYTNDVFTSSNGYQIAVPKGMPEEKMSVGNAQFLNNGRESKRELYLTEWYRDDHYDELEKAVDEYNARLDGAIAKEMEARAKETQYSIKKQEDNLTAVNKTFNENIERYKKKELPAGFRFELGMPSKDLLSAGFPNLPIYLRASLLAKKSNDTHHPYQAEELKDLVKQMQKPIAIFRYNKDNNRNVIVDIESNGKQFLVGVTLNYNNLEINSISGLFPKDNHEWIKWIQDGKAISIIDKNKVQTLIDSLRINPADSTRIGLNLDLTSKLVENFENPKFSDKDLENTTEFSIKGGKTLDERLHSKYVRTRYNAAREMSRDNDEALDILADTTPRTLEELIAESLSGADGVKLLWEDKGVKRGLKSHLGYGNDERKMMSGFLSKDGISPEHFAEQLEESADHLGIEHGDTMDMLDAVLDTVASRSKRELGDLLLNNRIDSALDVVRKQKEWDSEQEQAYLDTLPPAMREAYLAQKAEQEAVKWMPEREKEKYLADKRRERMLAEVRDAERVETLAKQQWYEANKDAMADAFRRERGEEKKEAKSKVQEKYDTIKKSFNKLKKDTQKEDAESVREVARQMREFIEEAVPKEMQDDMTRFDFKGLLKSLDTATSTKDLAKPMQAVDEIGTYLASRALNKRLGALLNKKYKSVNAKGVAVARAVDNSTRVVMDYAKQLYKEMGNNGVSQQLFGLRLDRNRERISGAKTLPYFLADNGRIRGGKYVPADFGKTAAVKSVIRLTPISFKEWENKYEDCDATPKTDKRLFREMGKELSTSAVRSKWSEKIADVANAYTKSITLNKDAFDCLIYNAYTQRTNRMQYLICEIICTY